MNTQITLFRKKILTKAKALFIAVAVVFALTGCDDKDYNEITPGKGVVTFKKMYPSAVNVKWYQQDMWQVAKFKINNFKTAAWYQTSGDWVMTTIDINLITTPTAVQTAFNASKYNKWKVNYVGDWQRPNIQTVYVLLVEEVASPVTFSVYRELHYAADGHLIREFDNQKSMFDPVPQSIPAQILNSIKTNYSENAIVDYQFSFSKGIFHVYIIDNGIYKDVVYDDAAELSHTMWRVSTVPTVVSDAFMASSYKDAIVNSISYLRYAAGQVVYLYDLNYLGQDKIFVIKADGTIPSQEGIL